MTQMKEGKKFLLDTGWVVLGNLSLIFVIFIQRLIITRFMGVEELGVYSLVMSIYAIGTTFVGFGLPMAMVKFSAEIRKLENEIKEFVSASLIITGALGILGGCLFPLVSGKLSMLLNISSFSGIVILFTPIFPFAALFFASLAILNGKREMKSYAIFQVLQNALFLLITLLLLSEGAGLTSIPVALCFSLAITTIILIIRHKLYIQMHHQIHGLAYHTERLLRFGIKLFASNLINQLNVYADYLLLAFFLSAEQVGYYTIAISISRLIWVLPGCVQKITFPAASEYWSNNDNTRLNLMVNKTLKYSSLLSIVSGIGVAFFAREIISILFGPEHISATNATLILLLGIVLNSALIYSIGGIFSAIGRPGLALKMNSLFFSLNMLLNIVLIPRYGVIGAAVSKSVSLIFLTLIQLFLVVRVVKIRLNVKHSIIIAFSAIPFIFARFVYSSFISGIVLFLLYVAIIVKIYYADDDIGFIKSLIFHKT
jgi:O-antigen/teichoic acid export membrane protein